MAARPVALHVAGPPAPCRPLAPRVRRLALELFLAGALVAGGLVGALLLFLLVLVAAPIAAALLTWLAWRSGDGAARDARRVRARIRRRARALGLVVLATGRTARAARW